LTAKQFCFVAFWILMGIAGTYLLDIWDLIR